MSEHAEQVALIQWCLTEARHTPDLGLIYAVPNAGKREGRQGIWMVSEGLRKGMLDLCLPVPVGPHHGYYLELKVGDNKPSREQEWWIVQLQARGYKVGVFWDWQLAAYSLELYLQIPGHRRTVWTWGPDAIRAQSRHLAWEADFLKRQARLLDEALDAAR